MTFVDTSVAELNPAAARLKNINAVSDLLTSTPDFKTALNSALGFILEIVQRPAGIIFIQESAERTPWIIARQNLSPEWLEQLEDPESHLIHLVSQVLEAGQTSSSASGIDLAAAMPLTSKSPDSSIVYQGVLVLQGQQLEPAVLEDLEEINRMIGRLASYQRRQLSGQLQGQELAALQMIINTLSTNPNAEDLQASITKGVSHILNAERCYLVTLDEENIRAVIKKTISEQDNWIYEANPQVPNGLVAECILSRRPILLNDVRKHALYNPITDSIDNIEPRSFLAAPMIADDLVQGAVVVINKKEGGFETYDQKLLTTMATLIAYSISGLNLVRQLKVTNADLQANRWELLRSRNILRALFDNIPQSFYTVDTKFTLLAINITRSERAGYDPAVLVGRKCYIALYNRSEPCPDCLVYQTLQKGETTFRVQRTWREDNEPLEWEISTYPILDENDIVIQAVVLEQDVTEKRHLEAKLIQSEKLAAVGQLAAGLAHEINNPLTAIIANAQLLERDPSLDPDVREAIGLISTAGARAGQVVRNLLDLSRREHQVLRPTNINENIQKALELLQYELLTREVILEFTPDPHLPEILASQEHLEGVWINLIVNAMDAMADKQDRKIKINTQLRGHQIEVTVSDTGIGIPPDRIDRIFEPFYTTKAAGHGTGLGLAVCQRILKEHSGFMRVNSRVGMGTEFIISIPID